MNARRARSGSAKEAPRGRGIRTGECASTSVRREADGGSLGRSDDEHAVGAQVRRDQVHVTVLGEGPLARKLGHALTVSPPCPDNIASVIYLLGHARRAVGGLGDLNPLALNVELVLRRGHFQLLGPVLRHVQGHLELVGALRHFEDLVQGRVFAEGRFKSASTSPSVPAGVAIHLSLSFSGNAHCGTWGIKGAIWRSTSAC
jgi:hypothetical protein